MRIALSASLVALSVGLFAESALSQVFYDELTRNTYSTVETVTEGPTNDIARAFCRIGSATDEAVSYAGQSRKLSGWTVFNGFVGTGAYGAYSFNRVYSAPFGGTNYLGIFPLVDKPVFSEIVCGTPERFAQIEIGSDGFIVGRTESKKLYFYDQNSNVWVKSSTFQQFDSISVVHRNLIYGTYQNQIYQYSAAEGPVRTLPGALSQVSGAADGSLWGVNSIGQIYRWNDNVVGGWQLVPGVLSQISVGNSGTVVGVNAYGNIYRYGGDAVGWVLMPGVLRQVSAAANGAIMGANSYGNIYIWNSASGWSEFGGAAYQVSVGIGLVAAMSAEGFVYRAGPAGWANLPLPAPSRINYR